MFFSNLIISELLICDPSLPKGTCSKKNKQSKIKNLNSFLLKVCEEDEFCDLHFGEEDDRCINKSSIPTLYPGEYCLNNYQCLSGICNKEDTHECEAILDEGDKCSFSYECPKTTYCAADPYWSMYFICTKLLDEKNDSYNCDLHELGFKCQTNLTCNRGKCVKPGSLKLGEITNSLEACETHYMYKLPEENNFFCTKGPILVDFKNKPIITDKPFPCQENELCNYTVEYKGKKIKLPTKKCTFPLNNSTNGYCHPGLGNMKLEISKLFNYLENYNGSCHAGNPVFCNFYNQTDTKFFDAYVAQTRIREYLKVYDNSECVKELVNSKYYYALNRSSFSLSGYYSIGFFQLIYLIIFFAI